MSPVGCGADSYRVGGRAARKLSTAELLHEHASTAFTGLGTDHPDNSAVTDGADVSFVVAEGHSVRRRARSPAPHGEAEPHYHD